MEITVRLMKFLSSMRQDHICNIILEPKDEKQTKQSGEKI